MITEHDYKLIDEYSLDGTGWARFSADRRSRYRLGRVVNARAVPPVAQLWNDEMWMRQWIRVVFVMLNPSTADAFKLDPTVARCVKFAQLWGADIVEVVNLFAFRTAHPRELISDYIQPNGDQVLAACRGAYRVVAAWGTGSGLTSRMFATFQTSIQLTRDMLAGDNITLYCLDRTPFGEPKHPLARGKHFIPYSKELEVF